MSDQTTLDQYRLLGRSGLRVSPLALGTMTFGTDWGTGWGSDREESRRIFDRYADLGGNFIDTANVYTGGTSESYVGEFVRDRRERFVIATKYSMGNPESKDPNNGGNQRKNLVQALEASLQRLNTDYIDLYWVHAWDGRTPIDEVMRALDDAVRQGKILYVGVSDMPAWKVAEANTLAWLRGWSPFIALQVEYSLVQRTPERDLIPMARDLALGVTPWSPLAGGVLTGKYSRKDLGKTNGLPFSDLTRKSVTETFGMLSERALGIADTVKAVAGETGATPAQVALAWVQRQPGVTSTILGAKRISQLDDNVGSLAVDLSDDQLERLDTASRIELGFPHDFLEIDFVRQQLDGGATILT
jgi:aryl-alcohol dehydrogenase-like predicted oxidoreductase